MLEGAIACPRHALGAKPCEPGYTKVNLADVLRVDDDVPESPCGPECHAVGVEVGVIAGGEWTEPYAPGTGIRCKNYRAVRLLIVPPAERFEPLMSATGSITF